MDEINLGIGYAQRDLFHVADPRWGKKKLINLAKWTENAYHGLGHFHLWGSDVFPEGTSRGNIIVAGIGLGD